MQVTRFMLKYRLYVSMSAIWRRNMWFAEQFESIRMHSDTFNVFISLHLVYMFIYIMLL